ncbi:MAG: LLM class F420-dependent oxidoreductase [Candidatus Binatia bacterium]
MKLGLLCGTMGPRLDMDLILEAERLGFDSVWTGEAYGSDAVTPLAWIGARTTKIKLGAAILQMPARTPAMTAMTAMTLDALSGGRFLLGVGPSGPQVAEGWHGMAYGKPLARTREYISIIRQVLTRNAPLQHEGQFYQIPYHGPDATGLGKPLKSILHGRADMKIYTASISPKSLELAGEIADGTMPIWMNPEAPQVFLPHLERGFTKAAQGKTLADFDLAPFVTCVVGSDLDACRAPVKANLALYIGGMGARTQNFYNELTRRMGYEEAAAKIQDLYLRGQKAAAIAAVPDQLVDQVALVGPRERIAERVQAWKACPATSMLIGTTQPEALRLLAELCL